MNFFLDEHLQLLEKLSFAKVEFMLIGGYSVIYYGYPRTTGDLDLWVRPDNENKLRLIDALKEFGFYPEDLEQLSKLDFSKYLVFSFGENPVKVDFITRINLVEYDNAEKYKVIEKFDGIDIPIIGLNELILSKFNTGREKDKADIEELQKLLSKKSK